MNKTEMRAYEELAEEILQEYTNCYSEVDKEVLAEMICNAGYHKQSDVVDDFVKRIKQYVDIDHSDCPTSPVFSERDLLFIVEKIAREMRDGE